MELETLQGARGFALRAPYPRGAAPCGTARTPFRCIFHAFDIKKNGENPLFYAGSRRFLVMSYKP